MWNMHSVDPHTGPPENPGLAPNYGLVRAPLDIIQAKGTYKNKNKNFQEDANMNWTERFLSIFTTKHSQAKSPHMKLHPEVSYLRSTWIEKT